MILCTTSKMIKEILNTISIETIKNLSINTIVAYAISWTYFFTTLPFITNALGKIKGTTVNYLISWGIMLVVIYVLQATGVLSIV